MDLNQAIAFRNMLAKMIRKGQIKTTPEYQAFSDAVNAALATPVKIRSNWWDLDCAADCWRSDAKVIGA